MRNGHKTIGKGAKKAKKKLPDRTCPRGAEDNALRTGSRWTFQTRFDNPDCILRPGQSNNLFKSSMCRWGNDSFRAVASPTCSQRTTSW
jgi:hypothetical protein